MTNTLTRTAGRAVLLGAATGARSTLGVGAPTLLLAHDARRRLARTTAVGAAVVGELIWDKLPNCPSRLEPPGLTARVVSAGIGGALLARSARQPVAPQAAIAVASALGAALVGTRWRRWWDQRHRPAWVSGAIEDAVGLAAAIAACR